MASTSSSARAPPSPVRFCDDTAAAEKATLPLTIIHHDNYGEYNIYVIIYRWLTCPKKKFHTISRYRLRMSTNIMVRRFSTWVNGFARRSPVWRESRVWAKRGVRRFRIFRSWRVEQPRRHGYVWRRHGRGWCDCRSAVSGNNNKRSRSARSVDGRSAVGRRETVRKTIKTTTEKKIGDTALDDR